MRNIYLMDEAVPIPKNLDSLPSYWDAVDSSIEKIDAGNSKSVAQWAESEFNKIFNSNGVTAKYDFSQLLYTFFKKEYWNEPEASFIPKKGIIVIGCSSYCSGAESDFQQAILHESAHATTSSINEVGIAMTEGIACCMEKKYCEYYDIPFDENIRDEGYVFSLQLVESIIKNVYDNNLDLFFERIKKGNEDAFIQDFDNYLKGCGTEYSAKDFLRLASLLFYAKNIPTSPFEDYKHSEEMGELRNEVIKSLSKEDEHESEKMNEVLKDIRVVEIAHNIGKSRLSYQQYYTFSITLDQKLAELLLRGQQFLTKDSIMRCVRETIELITNVNRDDGMRQ